MKKSTLIIIVIIGAALVSVGYVVFSASKGESASMLDGFAQCIREKGIIMYGADWCPHCQNEKRSFGNSFRLVPYVECPQDPKRCLAAGISGYPTWIFPDGKKLEGEQGTEKLSQESGCPLGIKD
ncbi:MAG: hypothetical protein HYW91_00410 [Candidatus Sungbacteria bacterium]|nr:hypothetical protein [Candidatus Sungbacteria bacterium]